MGLHEIRMPDVGEGITEAEIVEWNVAEGDLVREDDVLAAVMTDKATVEIPSPVDGKVVSIAGRIGDMTPVGATIITLQVSGSGNVAQTGAKASEPTLDKVGEAKPMKEDVKPEPQQPSEQRKATPAVALSGAPSASSPPRSAGEKPIASPAVRKRARDAGVQLRYVHGTGPAGRITHDDLDRFIAGGQEAPISDGLIADTGVEEIRIIGLRRKIAERMEESARSIPHITYVEEVDVTELEDLRLHLNESVEDRQSRLTVLPFILRAMVLALKKHRKFSAHYDDEQGVLRQYGGAHIGIATQTDNGLIVPVLRHAEARDLWGLAAGARDLADAARNGSIAREDVTGSTITLSSLGPLGGMVSTPIINKPEVAVVGVNKIVTRPVYRDGILVPRKIMNLSSSFDHRIIDGWDAAVFIQSIRASLEHPATVFMKGAPR